MADVVNLATTGLAASAAIAAAALGHCHLGCVGGHVLFACVPAVQVAVASHWPSHLVLAPLTAFLVLAGYPGLLFFCISGPHRCASARASIAMALSTMGAAAVAAIWACHYVLVRRRPPPTPPPQVVVNLVFDEDPPAYSETAAELTGNSRRPADPCCIPEPGAA